MRLVRLTTPMPRPLSVTLALTLAFVACDNVVRRPGEPAVYGVTESDSAMQAAIADTRTTVSDFGVRVQSPAAGQTYTAVKLPLREGDAVEHVWASDLAFDGQVFRGLLGNAPVNLPRWSIGDTVRVSRDSVSDWMLIQADTVYGAYTVHVLIARMGADERASFAQEQGVVFPVGPKPIP